MAISNHTQAIDPGAIRRLHGLSDTDTEDILDDIYARIHVDVDGFLDKYFLSPSSASAPPPTASAFLKWLATHLADDANGGRWKLSLPAKATVDNAAGADLVLLRPTEPDAAAQSQWARVGVIGQFSRDNGPAEYEEGFLRFCNQARDVFANQPTRFFIHGFFICGQTMELWVFDRSGMYSSSAIDIQSEFNQFLSVIDHYALLDDEELGIAQVLKADKIGQFVEAHGSHAEGLERLYLEHKPIARSENLFGPGTTAYRAKLPKSDRWSHVVKFKWRTKNDGKEEDILQVIKEKNVWGVTSIDYFEYITRTSYLRGGLQYSSYRRFVPDLGKKEELVKTWDSSEQDIYDYTEESGKPFEDLILTCVVTSPVARSLRSFKSRTELLEALRDAIRAHRSLLTDARIIHQDISTGNILITDAPRDDEPRGILIDLDVATQLDSGRSNAREITGTPPFMAIDVLKGRRHTYRHDLESFFYVFVWVLISNGNDDPPDSSRLQQWVGESFDDLAEQKLKDMRQEDFASIIAEFPPEFESLRASAEEIRQILFTSRDGSSLWTGTDGSSEAMQDMYRRIIDVFDRAITSNRL